MLCIFLLLVKNGRLIFFSCIGCFFSLFLIDPINCFSKEIFQQQWQDKFENGIEQVAFDSASKNIFLESEKWIIEISPQGKIKAIHSIEGAKKAIAYDDENKWIFYQLVLDSKRGLYYIDDQKDQNLYLSNVFDFCLNPITKNVVCSCLSPSDHQLTMLACFNSRKELIWHYPLRSEAVIFNFDLSSGNLVCSDLDSNGQRIFCLDPNGKLLWSHFIQGKSSVIDCSAEKGRIFYGISQEGLYCLNEHGEIDWKYPLARKTEWIDGIFVDAESEKVFVESHDDLRHFYCFNLGGQLLWEYSIKRDGQRKAVIDVVNKKFFILAHDGKKLRCLDYEKQCLWEYSFDCCVNKIFVDSKNCRLICVTLSGFLKSISYASFDFSTRQAIEQWELETIDEKAVRDLRNRSNPVGQWQFKDREFTPKEIFFDPINESSHSAVFWVGNKKYSGWVYCLSQEGELKESWQLPGGIQSAWYHYGQKQLFYISYDGQHHIFDLGEGQKADKIDQRAEVTAYYFDANSKTIFCGKSKAANHCICCLSDNGEEIWSHPVENKVVTIDYDAENKSIFYGLEYQDGFYCVDLNGDIKWRYPAMQMTEEPSKVVVDTKNGKIFLGTYDHRYAHLCCLDFEGHQLWKYSVKGRIVDQGLVTDPKSKKIFFASTHDSNLYCLNSVGKLLWKHQFDSPVCGIALDIENKVLFCSMYDGCCQAIGYSF